MSLVACWARVGLGFAVCLICYCAADSWFEIVVDLCWVCWLLCTSFAALGLLYGYFACVSCVSLGFGVFLGLVVGLYIWLMFVC